MMQLPSQDKNSPNCSQSQVQIQQNSYQFLYISFGLFCFVILMLTLPFYQSEKKENNLSLFPVSQQWQKDGIYAGQIHYPRIPEKYWQHRIRMIKSMGLNALSIYIFWNFHQIERGVFDFQTQNKNITKFLQLAQKYKMKVLIRPGPYVCAEWDLGGLPARLLSLKDIQLRSFNQIYLEEVKIYFSALAPILKPFLINKSQGPTIILFQIQNQYGFVGTDKRYINKLRQMWIDLGIVSQFYYVDWLQNVPKSYWQGASIGINNGYPPTQYQKVRLFNKNGKIFGGQIYSGWFSSWGGKLKGKSIQKFLDEYRKLLSNNHSFAMYMAHGGTNFGLSVGANYAKSYDSSNFFMPLATTYDYDAPINEQGSPNLKYFQFKKLISYFVDYQIPAPPQKIPLMNISQFVPSKIGTVFDSQQLKKVAINSSPKLFLFQSVQLKMFHQGLVLYQTFIKGSHTYLFQLSVSDIAIIYLDGQVLKILNRTQYQNHTVIANCQLNQCKLHILVEAMGHVNFGADIQNDKKGMHYFRQVQKINLKDKDNFQIEQKNPDEQVIFLWNMYKVQIEKQPQWKNIGKCQNFPCLFKAEIQVNKTQDTYLNLSKFQKGYVWVNGYNLGRFWNIGPTYNLFCPGVWLKVGKNTITILDMLGKQAGSIWGTTQSELIYKYQ